MKARTKREKMVLELSGKLHPISEAQRKWAFGLFPIDGYYYADGRVWCQCCGYVDNLTKSELSVSLGLDYHICPECGRCIQLTHIHKGEFYNHEKIVSIITAFRGWLVIRTYKAVRINDTPGVKTELSIEEIYQNWIDDEGKETIVTRPYRRSIYSVNWNTWMPMEIGHHNYSANGCYIFDDMFNPDLNYFYPRVNVTSKLRRNGWTNDIVKHRIPVSAAIIQLLSNPLSETVIKQGQLEVFKYMIEKGNYQLPYVYALNICHRNRYIIKDASMWFDYMDLLSSMDYDTHNAYYVCPVDLAGAHDKMVAKKKKCDEAKQIEAMMQDDEAYKSEKSAFLGISFYSENICISVLQSVKDFYDEGESMHHCVYSNEYYKKKDSLIMSAKVGGKRMETVEISLTNFQIVQSRAICNGISEYHNRIVELVNKNMYQIRRAAV